MKVKSLVAIVASVPVQPFAWLDDGRPVYPLRGAESDKDDVDDDADAEDEDEDADDDDEDEDVDDAASGGDSGSKNNGHKDKRVAELSQENKRRRLAEKKLKKELEASNAKLKEVEDKDKSELEKLKADHEELLEKSKKLAKLNREGAIERAFLKDSKHKWHSADAALKLVDLEDVEYDEDTGEVTGMKDAIKDLAKNHPYLINKGDDEGDDDTGGAGDGSKGGTPTGGSIGGSGKKKGGRNAERARLEKRFPALTRG